MRAVQPWFSSPPSLRAAHALSVPKRISFLHPIHQGLGHAQNELAQRPACLALLDALLADLIRLQSCHMLLNGLLNAASDRPINFESGPHTPMVFVCAVTHRLQRGAGCPPAG